MNKEWKEYKFEDILKVSSGKGLVESDFILGFYKVYGGNGIIGYHSFYTNIKSELIIGRVGAHCGNIHITRPNSWITDNALILKFLIANQNIMFWFYLLKFKKLRDIAFQSAQPVVTAGTLKNITLNLPPLPQQKKIANILSTCDRVIEKTEQAIAKYQALKQGMMQDLFARGINPKTGKLRPSYLLAPHLYKKSPLGFIPLEWEVVTVEKYASQEKYAIVDGPFGSNLKTIHYKNKGVPIIQSGFVTSNKFYAKKYLFVDKEKYYSEIRSSVKSGDLIMAKIGAQCGTCAILPKNHLTGILAGNCLKITVEENNTKYLMYLLHLYKTNGKLELITSTTAQPAISMASLKIMKIPKPTIQEQTQIAQKLESIDQKIALEQEVLVKYQQLKSGLMQDLLTAKVLVSV